MSNAIDVFAQPGRIGELKHLLEVQAAEIAIAERYVENARYLSSGNPVNIYHLALCSDFINAAMDSEEFFGELRLLTLDQLAFASIAFAPSHLDKLKQYFKASSIQTYFSTQQHLIGHQQLDQITKRLRKYAKKHPKFQVLLVARNDQSISKVVEPRSYSLTSARVGPLYNLFSTEFISRLQEHDEWIEGMETISLVKGFLRGATRSKGELVIELESRYIDAHDFLDMEVFRDTSRGSITGVRHSYQLVLRVDQNVIDDLFPLSY